MFSELQRFDYSKCLPKVHRTRRTPSYTNYNGRTKPLMYRNWVQFLRPQNTCNTITKRRAM